MHYKAIKVTRDPWFVM